LIKDKRGGEGTQNKKASKEHKEIIEIRGSSRKKKNHPGQTSTGGDYVAERDGMKKGRGIREPHQGGGKCDGYNTRRHR